MLCGGIVIMDVIMEYQRLTKRRKDGSVALDFYSNSKDFTIVELKLRLAELEDKIENGTLVPKYSIVDCGGTYCVCTVDTDNLIVIDEYDTEEEAKEKLEELKNGI